ncbi:MAG: OmpH family outer membrane protein [Firmicutes bacterium]|nr:OmpH family outer membrane protein [Bacillota bacterium]
MKFQSFKVIAASIMLCLAFCFSGCKVDNKTTDESAQKSRDLKVGYIDSDKLIAEDPDFKSFFNEKQKQAQQLQEKFGGKELSPEEQKNLEKLTKEFAAKEARILGTFVAKAREASTRVMEEKKLDLVLNNAASRSVMEYGGEDITDDVKVKITELEKSKNASGGKKE